MFINIYSFGGWFFGQAGHAHNIAGDGYHETCACSDLNFPYGHNEVFRTAQQFGIVGE